MSVGTHSRMVEFRHITPVLRVTDLQRSVDFYVGLLGFEIAWRAANDGCGENAMLTGGSTSVLLSTGSHLGERPQFSGTLYFEVAGLDELHERIGSHVEFVWPLEQM